MKALAALAHGLAVAAGTILCTGAMAQTPSQISLVIATGAGGGYDLYGRLAAQHLGRFLPGQPAVVARNMPGGGSIVAANWLYNSAPRDGTALAILQNGTAFAPLFGVAQAQFAGDKFTWLASLNRLVNIGLVWHETPFADVQDIFSREIVLGSSGGNTSTMPNILNSLLGTKFKVVAGYKSTNDVTLAMERREVDGLLGTSWDSFKATKSDWVRDRKARVLLQVSFDSHAELAGVPNLSSLVKRPEDRELLEVVLARQIYGRPFAAPPGIPATSAKALQEAFRKMAADKNFLADADKRQAEITFNTGDEVKALVEKIYASPRPLIERAIVELNKAGE
ncbi:MAG: Bug family tripartite tricarboxylate transporter substrate binding protein [Beijerinckiaceae bacterium]